MGKNIKYKSKGKSRQKIFLIKYWKNWVWNKSSDNKLKINKSLKEQEGDNN